MIWEIKKAASDGFPAGDVLCLKLDAISGKDEPGLGAGSAVRRLALRAASASATAPGAQAARWTLSVWRTPPHGPAKSDLLVPSAAEPLGRRILVPKGGQEGISKFGGVEGLLCQLGDGLFNLDGVHSAFRGLIRSMPQPSKSGVFRVATGAPWACAIAAIWQSACRIGQPAARRPAAMIA